MSWLRLYTDILTDAKIMQLGGSHFKTWVLCLCSAKDNGGKLPSINDLAFALRLRKDVCEQHLKTLIEAGLIDVEGDEYKPHNWDSRQFVSDDVNGRVKAFRDRKRNVSCNVSRNVSGNAHETEVKPLARAQSQSTDYREEDSLSGVEEAAQAPVAVPAPTPTRQARFVPPTPAEVRDHAATFGYTVDAERFCAYYGSKGWVVGKAPMKNWKLAVANWSRNESSMTAATRPPPKQTATDILREKYAKEAAEKARLENAN